MKLKSAWLTRVVHATLCVWVTVTTSFFCTYVFALGPGNRILERLWTTVLWNLSALPDIRLAIQAAVIGMSVRHDVLELLEKRVMSRFSHRTWLISKPQGNDEVSWCPNPGPLIDHAFWRCCSPFSAWQNRLEFSQVAAAMDSKQTISHISMPLCRTRATVMVSRCYLLQLWKTLTLNFFKQGSYQMVWTPSASGH